MGFSLSPFAPENLVLQDGSAVPSRASLVILHTQCKCTPGFYGDGGLKSTAREKRKKSKTHFFYLTGVDAQKV